MNKLSLYLLPTVLVAALSASAQYNQKGMVHLSIGGAIGVHATELEYTILGFKGTETDGAATTSVPIRVAAGLTNRFTLGFLFEPGRYLPDSADADVQSNRFFHFAVEPKFYLLNGQRVAWTASAQVGAMGLRMQDNTPGEKLDARWIGGAFGLGTGLNVGFGETVGVGLDVRYMSTNMELKEIEVNDVSISDFYDATLRTGGVVVELNLTVRLGGS